MHSFHLVFLTLWISTSAANPYPQDDLAEQRPNSNSLTTESDLELGKLDLYVANEDSNNIESCNGDGTAKTIGKRGRMCPVSGIQAPAKPKVGVPSGALYVPQRPGTKNPTALPALPDSKDQNGHGAPKTESGSGIPPDEEPPTIVYWQGPCSWPVKFLCCLGDLILPGGNVMGCWHCRSFPFYPNINLSFQMEPDTTSKPG